MASMSSQLHFVLVPLMSPGHTLPMVDMAKLIAERGAIVSLVTTTGNASRFESTLSRARESCALQIRLIKLPFPSQEVGLPIGYENLDSLPSRDLLRNFFTGLAKLQEPLECILEQENPPPSCIISDRNLSWTVKIAQRFNVPRIVFHGMCCFSLLSSHNIWLNNSHFSVASDSEPFEVQGVPKRFKITRAQLPGAFVSLPDLDDVRSKMREAESSAYGVVVNSFEELEHGCAEAYEKALNKKVWCIGPVSLCNRENADKFERGNRVSVDEKKCMEWLDSMKPRSLIYACLGSLCRLVPSQLIELGLALEGSKHPFIWAVKTGEETSEFEEWLKNERFEERIKGRGLLIKGWAPQVFILSHPAIGGFLTHCGWNSTLEGICFGLPMITWPLFAEQFLNEKLVIEILKIGVRTGVEVPVRWGEEEKVGVLVKRNEIEKAISMLMDGGEEGEERRKRAIELGEMARKAMEFGGSSYLNLTLLIQDIMQHLQT